MARATKPRAKKPRAKILADGTLMIDGVIGDEWDGLTSAQVVSEIRDLGEIDEIHVLINSPGGLVTDGLAIHHELATHPATVIVEISGVAASMASAIAMAGDTVRMSKNAHLMIHDPWNVAVGDAEDLREAADLLDQFGTSLVNIYVDKTGLEESEIRDMMAAETWLTADEALEKGFIDEVIEPVSAEAFADLDISELASVPAALTRLIREGRQMARAKKGGVAPEPTKAPKKEPAAQGGDKLHDGDVEDAIQRALAAERTRAHEIRQLAERVGLDRGWADEQVSAGVDLAEARATALDALAKRQEGDGPSNIPSGIRIGSDERDRFVEGASAWLIRKAGRARLVETHTGTQLNPGEFRGMSLLDLARASIELAGGSTRGLSKLQVAAAALGIGPRAQAGLGTRSDFPVLLENVLHKMLMAAYETQPDSWSRFCARGSVSDFRPHPRLRLGSFGRLDDILESGEFQQKHFPDAEKENISAGTVGNIVGLTRQAIVNDDVDGFSRLITMLGRAAALSIEVDVFALLAENGGLGPKLSDGKELFHADHNNIGAASAISVEALEADRVLMASQKDPDGNEYLDLRPSVLVVPIGLGGQARVINEAQYDPDTPNKLQRPNMVNGLFEDIVDTPRVSGTRRYLFADPQVAPVLEVVFLDGEEAPVLETEEGFDYDGIRWRVRHDYGVGATDFRGAVTNAGS